MAANGWIKYSTIWT